MPILEVKLISNMEFRIIDGSKVPRPQWPHLETTHQRKLSIYSENGRQRSVLSVGWLVGVLVGWLFHSLVGCGVGGWLVGWVVD